MQHAERFWLIGQVALVLDGPNGLGRQTALGLSAMPLKAGKLR
jgi:hypothetical protein